MISIIVAIAENGAIGRNNDLLWHLPDDLKFFKNKTLGHAVIMGLNTYNSLPVRPLKNRRNIVIVDDVNVNIDGCEMAYSIEEAIALSDQDNENFICGGASIYRQFMPFADTMYITKVLKDFEADVFFPNIDESEWRIITQSEIFTDEKTGLQYRFIEYKRILPPSVH